MFPAYIKYYFVAIETGFVNLRLVMKINAKSGNVYHFYKILLY